MISHAPCSFSSFLFFFVGEAGKTPDFRLTWSNIPVSSTGHELHSLITHWNSYYTTYHTFLSNLFKDHSHFNRSNSNEYYGFTCQLEISRRKMPPMTHPFFPACQHFSANKNCQDVLSPILTELNRLRSNWLCRVCPTWGHIDCLQWREVSQPPTSTWVVKQENGNGIMLASFLHAERQISRRTKAKETSF